MAIINYRDGELARQEHGRLHRDTCQVPMRYGIGMEEREKRQTETGHDDVREALLLLGVQDGETSLLNNAVHDVQMTDETAVNWVQSAALACHVIL